MRYIAQHFSTTRGKGAKEGSAAKAATAKKSSTKKTATKKSANKVRRLMRHGGIVGVVDHVASPGDPRVTVAKLHRIDPECVKADFESAGFEFVGQSDALANPNDDHTQFSSDPAIVGTTDRFVSKFVKP